MNDHRQKAFSIKFTTAGDVFGVKPDKIVSLKIRDNVGSYSEYHDMIQSLEQEFGVQSSPVRGELQGRGYLLTKEKARAILVEHETGLEILYVAGSIASLVALVPMILQAWGAIRRFTSPHNPFHRVEVRRLNDKGVLQEDTVQMSRHCTGDSSSLVLVAVAGLLEDEFKKLIRQIERTSPQITSLERRLAKVEAFVKDSKPSKRKSKPQK
jgi:hypothetical protein